MGLEGTASAGTTAAVDLVATAGDPAGGGPGGGGNGLRVRQFSMDTWTC